MFSLTPSRRIAGNDSDNKRQGLQHSGGNTVKGYSTVTHSGGRCFQAAVNCDVSQESYTLYGVRERSEVSDFQKFSLVASTCRSCQAKDVTDQNNMYL